MHHRIYTPFHCRDSSACSFSVVVLWKCSLSARESDISSKKGLQDTQQGKLVCWNSVLWSPEIKSNDSSWLTEKFPWRCIILNYEPLKQVTNIRHLHWGAQLNEWSGSLLCRLVIPQGCFLRNNSSLSKTPFHMTAPKQCITTGVNLMIQLVDETNSEIRLVSE